MRKILTIAIREYRAMVGTKAFLVSMIMMPVLMFGGLAALRFLPSMGEVKERKLVICEGNNQLFAALQQAAEAHNQLTKKSAESTATASEELSPGLSRGELFFLERDDRQLDDQSRLELSQRIRDGEIYAFVEIPNDLLNAPPGTAKIQLYSQDSSIAEARMWLNRVVNDIVRRQRLSQNFDATQIAAIDQASQAVVVAGMSLVEASANGQVKTGKEKNELTDIFLPMGLMMLMFMVIFMAAQPMLEAVLEEKSQRIAEVLLGSVSPTQLLMGKLLGTVSGSLTIFFIYFLGSYFLAQQKGWTDNLPWELLPWFLIFQILGVLLYSAIFMAVGASVSQLKEAQSLLLPVWMVMMLPIFVWLFIVRDPLGPLAQWFSWFPPSASTTMVLRLATNQPIPLWERWISLLGLVLTTWLVIVIAGRIFRVGILWQGKVPKLKEILKWAWAG